MYPNSHIDNFIINRVVPQRSFTTSDKHSAVFGIAGVHLWMCRDRVAPVNKSKHEIVVKNWKESRTAGVAKPSSDEYCLKRFFLHPSMKNFVLTYSNSKDIHLADTVKGQIINGYACEGEMDCVSYLNPEHIVALDKTNKSLKMIDFRTGTVGPSMGKDIDCYALNGYEQRIIALLHGPPGKKQITQVDRRKMNQTWKGDLESLYLPNSWDIDIEGSRRNTMSYSHWGDKLLCRTSKEVLVLKRSSQSKWELVFQHDYVKNATQQDDYDPSPCAVWFNDRFVLSTDPMKKDFKGGSFSFWDTELKKRIRKVKVDTYVSHIATCAEINAVACTIPYDNIMINSIWATDL